MNILPTSFSFFRYCIFVLLFAAQASLLAEESNTPSQPPIAIAPHASFPTIAPGIAEEDLPAPTITTLFSPLFLGQDSNFILSSSVACCISHRSNHEFRNDFAFAGILENGDIYAWGHSDRGGISPVLPQNEDGTSKKARSIFSNRFGFIAVLDDGSLWQWGYSSSATGTGLSLNHTVNQQVQLPFEKKVTCCMASTALSFAVILEDGSLFAWGDPSAGKTPLFPLDDNKEPKKPCCLYSNQETFTAVFPDKTLLAWGNLNKGGVHDTKTISLPPQAKLQSCCSVASTEDAFAGILEDGTIFVWGKSANQFKAPKIPAGERPIFITASNNDFTLLLEDERHQQSFLSWGLHFHGQETKLPAGKKIKSPCCIAATRSAFAAILEDGSLFAWGDPSYGGSFLNQPKNRSGSLIKACCIVANDGAFSATLEDGSIITWGNYWYGGTYFYNHGNIFPADEEQGVYASSTKACALAANDAAFSATLDDGSLLAWGKSAYGGSFWQEDYSGNKHHVGVKLFARFISPRKKANVKALVSNNGAFAAVTDSGSLLKWGDTYYGGGNDENIQPYDLPQHQKLMTIASPLKKETYYSQDELAGIAIIGNAVTPQQGEWQFFHLTTHTWMTIPTTLSPTQALVLSAAVKIRFLPNPHFIGPVSGLSVKLLDVKAPVVTGSFMNTTLEACATCSSATTVELETRVEEVSPSHE